MKLLTFLLLLLLYPAWAYAQPPTGHKTSLYIIYTEKNCFNCFEKIHAALSKWNNINWNSIFVCNLYADTNSISKKIFIRQCRKSLPSIHNYLFRDSLPVCINADSVSQLPSPLIIVCDTENTYVLDVQELFDKKGQINRAKLNGLLHKM